MAKTSLHPDQAGALEYGLHEAQAWVADWVERKGWKDDRTFGDCMALLHSEISEALEAYREHGLKDFTQHSRPEEEMCPMDMTCTTHKPEGVGSEYADLLIRMLDDCERHGVNLFEEFMRKMAYNETRAWRHGGRAL